MPITNVTLTGMEPSAEIYCSACKSFRTIMVSSLVLGQYAPGIPAQGSLPAGEPFKKLDTLVYGQCVCGGQEVATLFPLTSASSPGAVIIGHVVKHLWNEAQFHPDLVSDFAAATPPGVPAQDLGAAIVAVRAAYGLQPQ
jgi:hypothetical protein